MYSTAGMIKHAASSPKQQFVLQLKLKQYTNYRKTIRQKNLSRFIPQQFVDR